MSRSSRATPGWLPAVVVLAVVLLAGARLIVLSVQQRAATLRAAAQTEAVQAAHDIESQLQLLTDRAGAQAERAIAIANAAAAPAALATVTPLANGFWITADGSAVPTRNLPPTIVNGIVGEWNSIPRHTGAALPIVLGPTRQGSQWLIVALVPIQSRSAATPAGWSVACVDLDRMLAAIHLGRIVNAGYDFALAQIEARDDAERIFFNSSPAPLAEPATLTVHLPLGFAPADTGSFADRRPAADRLVSGGEIATLVGVLAVLAWLLVFGAHDMSHSLQRLRAGVTIYRRRLQTLSGRLTAETEKRQDLQKSIDHARYHDGFTGLPNRRYFVDQLDRALREVRTRRRPRIGIILTDIARFRVINDTLGHTVGDDLMVQSARRFEKAIAPFDCVLARWGGDQFAILMLDVADSQATLAFAAVLQEALRAPFELRRHRLRVTANMGVTCVESGLQRAEDVLRETDIALSVAKKQEHRKAILYSPAMGGQAVSLVSLEADLHVALAKNELRLLFQPIVDLRRYRAVGAETLLRWRHPVEGMLTPDKFLSIAEEAGLMVPITRKIILRVCRLAAEWRRNLPAEQAFFLSINLSASVLRDPALSEYVARVLQETGVPAAALKFEVTEASLIANVGAARETLERLHKLGVQLMLDDFGTGFSSLNYLQLFPLDFVKIDRPFVSRAVSDRANSGMMSALQLAPSLGMSAIAEIVETEAAAAALRQMGCEFGQGYYFSEPVQAEVVLQYLRGEPLPLRGGSAGDASPPLSAADVPSTASTIDIPALVAVEPAVADSSPMAIVDLDGSPTAVVATPIDSSPTVVVAAPDSSPTAVVKRVDSSPTAVLPPLDTSATAIMIPLDEAPTMVLPPLSVTADPNEEDDDEDDRQAGRDPRQRLGSH